MLRRPCDLCSFLHRFAVQQCFRIFAIRAHINCLPVLCNFEHYCACLTLHGGTRETPLLAKHL